MQQEYSALMNSKMIDNTYIIACVVLSIQFGYYYYVSLLCTVVARHPIVINDHKKRQPSYHKATIISYYGVWYSSTYHSSYCRYAFSFFKFEKRQVFVVMCVAYVEGNQSHNVMFLLIKLNTVLPLNRTNQP